MSALGTRPLLPGAPAPDGVRGRGEPAGPAGRAGPHRPPGGDATAAASAGVEGRRRLGPTVWAALLIALLLLPFVPLVLASFSQAYFHPQVVPQTWSLRAWGLVLGPGAGTWAALRDSVVVAVAVTGVSLIVAIPAGRVLATRRFRGRRAVEMVLLLPVLVPGIAVAIGLHVTFLRLGLAGSLPGVVLVHLVPATPYVVLLSAGVFANADLGLEDQARTLGASPWQVAWSVTRPLVAPGLAVAALFGFLVSWGQYATTLVVGGGQVVTLPMLLFASAAGGDVAVTAATALVHGLPALVLLVVTARVLGRGAATVGGGR
ncbi:MAG: ABC transporter permease subunit [Nitriliruptoraceae bacterium]